MAKAKKTPDSRLTNYLSKNVAPNESEAGYYRLMNKAINTAAGAKPSVGRVSNAERRAIHLAVKANRVGGVGTIAEQQDVKKILRRKARKS